MRTHRAYGYGKWFYGTNFVLAEDFWWHTDENGTMYLVGTPEPSTGVFDKYGKEFYLNDIVQHKHGFGVVVYENGQYSILWRSGAFYKTHLDSPITKHIRIVSNVTEEKL